MLKWRTVWQWFLNEQYLHIKQFTKVLRLWIYMLSHHLILILGFISPQGLDFLSSAWKAGLPSLLAEIKNSSSQMIGFDMIWAFAVLVFAPKRHLLWVFFPFKSSLLQSCFTIVLWGVGDTGLIKIEFVTLKLCFSFSLTILTYNVDPLLPTLNSIMWMIKIFSKKFFLMAL